MKLGPILFYFLIGVSSVAGGASLGVELAEPAVHVESPYGPRDSFVLRFEVDLDGADEGLLRVWINDSLQESIEVTEARSLFHLGFGENGELPHQWDDYEITAQISSETGNEEVELTVNPHDEEASTDEEIPH